MKFDLHDVRSYLEKLVNKLLSGLYTNNQNQTGIFSPPITSKFINKFKVSCTPLSVKSLIWENQKQMSKFNYRLLVSKRTPIVWWITLHKFAKKFQLDDSYQKYLFWSSKYRKQKNLPYFRVNGLLQFCAEFLFVVKTNKSILSWCDCLLD